METDIKNDCLRDIEIWKKRLLDLSRRNNLINYKDNKSSTLELLLPTFYDAYKRITSNDTVEVFDDRTMRDDTGDEFILSETYEKTDREQYLSNFRDKITKSQILFFNSYKSSYSILKKLMKKASDSITENGVNILYIAFGFIVWRENENSNILCKAPLLMLPVKIVNEAVNKPYYIHHLDEDASVNITLQYMLKNQYGIELPELADQTIEEYLDAVENSISVIGWKVLREARIATFSFNKLNMYIDLDKNRDKVSVNSNIAALTETNADIENVFINNEELENVSNSRDIFAEQHNVVDADFSQSEAIEYAKMGKSFVLQGPPGTGKSQTITNIIAELIYSGKKVLFVSEKMAALEVVYNNLKKVNLSDFCLELHSYKANKKDFINDIYDTLNKPKTIVDDKAKKNLINLNDIIGRLNAYDSALYELHEPINMSLYQLIGQANHYMNTKEVAFVIEEIANMSTDDLDRNCNLLNRYSGYEKSIGYNYKNNSLYGLLINDTSFTFKIRIKELLEKAVSATKSIIEQSNIIKDTYGINLSTNQDVTDFVAFVNFCVNNGFTKSEMFDAQLIEGITEAIDDLKVSSNIINTETEIINEKYTESIFSSNFNEIYDNYLKYGNSFIKRVFNKKYKSVKSELACFRNKKRAPSYKKAVADLKVLINRENNIARFNEASATIEELGFVQFNGVKTDWTDLKSKLKEFVEGLNKQLTDGSLLGTIDFGAHNDKLIEDLTNTMVLIDNIEDEIKPYIDDQVFDLSSATLNDKYSRFDNYLNNSDSFDVWVEFLHLYFELRHNKLDKFVDEVISDNYPLAEIENYYKLCFYRQWVDYILKNDPTMYNYNRLLHEADIKEFSICDITQLDISKARINAKLSQMRPDPMLKMVKSPTSIIIREHEKKRKHKAIRSLMGEITEFIQELKPCFLMSPLSVSTYLPDDISFDVTIFDEASQVFPEDAVGAIYRSKQLIVVGDSKQMPPSNFFMANNNDEDQEYDEEDSDIDSYESVLDICSATFPTKSLLCHYRSKDEGLIDFSNKNFYNYDLITYPSIYQKKEDLGVEFIYVSDGIMDSQTKINIKEAEKTVDLVFEHFRKYPSRSLGVVAFNIRQQDLILKLLDRRRSEDPSLEEYFRQDINEPFFVKNLETVQGDERDTVIFSVTYAKNEKGQFALRFGPLNTLGGERRLNVAITRAKLNVKVVSSIRAYDIDASKVTNIGPKLLRDYLDYAEHGENAFNKTIGVNNAEQFNSQFEQDVYEFLKSNGYDVVTQVGCSKYRIDVGLRRPGTSDYVLAIECDGATYHNSKSARDRDRLRKDVLEKMGWKFYRIWSTDWYRNNAVEKAALLDACKTALEDKKSFFIETDTPEKTNIENMVRHQAVSGSVDIFDKYTQYNGEITGSVNKITKLLTKIEGPISIDYLLKRICFIWGSDKVTQSIKYNFLSSFKQSAQCIMESNFLYGANQKNYAMRKDLGRYFKDINNISDYEIRNGMYSAVKVNVSCKKDDLFLFISNNLGFTRKGDKIVRKLENAFDMLKPYINIDSEGDITVNKDNQLLILRRPEQN